jgi:hypothetical protein
MPGLDGLPQGPRLSRTLAGASDQVLLADEVFQIGRADARR